MRKTTKSILIAGIGTVLSLGVVFGTGQFDIDTQAWSSGALNRKVDLGKKTDIDLENEAYERTMARVNEEALALRQEIVDAGSKVENRTVDGVASQVKGLYLLDEIEGMAITLNKDYYPADSTTDTSKVEIAAYETDATKSPQAIEAAKEITAVSFPGAVMGPSINVQYKWPDGDETSILVGDYKFGINDSFKKDGSTYKILAVYPGGYYKFFEDTDDNPDTISIRRLGSSDDNITMLTLIRVD